MLIKLMIGHMPCRSGSPHAVRGCCQPDASVVAGRLGAGTARGRRLGASGERHRSRRETDAKDSLAHHRHLHEPAGPTNSLAAVRAGCNRSFFRTPRSRGARPLPRRRAAVYGRRAARERCYRTQLVSRQIMGAGTDARGRTTQGAVVGGRSCSLLIDASARPSLSLSRRADRRRSSRIRSLPPRRPGASAGHRGTRRLAAHQSRLECESLFAVDGDHRANVATLAPSWTYKLGGNSTAVPIVVGGVMYLPSRDRVVALDGDTGALVWEYVLPGPASSAGGRGAAGPAAVAAAPAAAARRRRRAASATGPATAPRRRAFCS